MFVMFVSLNEVSLTLKELKLGCDFRALVVLLKRSADSIVWEGLSGIPSPRMLMTYR